MRVPARRSRLALGTAVMVSALVAAGSGTSMARVARGTPSCVPPVPSSLPKDPNGVAHKLTGAAKAAMGGYPGTVYASPWSHYKPKHGPPWVIGMSNNEGNLNAQDVLKGLQAEAKLNPGLVKKIITTTPPTPNDVTTQIQQMRSLVQQHVDFIISTLGSPTALNGVIDQAAKANIPVISLLGQSTDKHAVNLQPNPIQLGYYGAKGLLTSVGSGTGPVLRVDGIPGPVDRHGHQHGGNRGLQRVPHANRRRSVVGKFDPTIAKTQVLTFLSAHPGTSTACSRSPTWRRGSSARSRRSAARSRRSTTSAHRPPRWSTGSEHAKSGYKGSGVAIPAIKDGTYSMAVALAMLRG